MSRSTAKQNSNQLATLTAHATQLQARLLVALDTLDSQNLSHESELAALQKSYDKLAARARRLEYERNAANEDLSEMTAVLELVIEKVSAANDYKVLAHSDLHLPMPLSPPRTRAGQSSRRRATSDTPSDESAYTAALVSALTTQLEAARAQANREKSEAERKIARLEAMVELRDIELRRNLRRSVNGPEGNTSTADASGSEDRTTTPGMSRGEAIAAYENIAKDNERLEKEVARLKAELASAEFNRATSEIGTSSSWAQLPEWARPQPVASGSKPAANSTSKSTAAMNAKTPTSSSSKTKPPHVDSESSDRAPSSMSEPHTTPTRKPVLQREDSSASDPSSYRPPRPSSSQPRTRSSASTSDPHRARPRSSRHTTTVTVSASECGSEETMQRMEAATSKPARRSNLRDSGIGGDSGSEATRATQASRTRIKQEDLSDRPLGQDAADLMPALPVLTPSKVRAPRVEAVDLPSTSYIEPSFGVSLRKKGRPRSSEPAATQSRESTRTNLPSRLSPSLLEPPQTAALVPIPSPRAISPVGEFLLPPSVVSREDRPAGVMPVGSPPVDALSPPGLSLEPQATIQSPPTSQSLSALQPPALQPPAILQSQATLQSPPTLQPAPVILQPSPMLHSTIQQTHQQQRSRSSSRTARLSPLPIFDLTGLPAYEALQGTGTSSAPAQTKSGEFPLASPPTAAGTGTTASPTAATDSPIRRQSDPSPNTQSEPHPLIRQRSNSAAPSTPPRSTNNTAQFAFITPVHDTTYSTVADKAPANGASTTAEPATTLGANATAAETLPNNSATTSRRPLLPLFKFMSPSPATPPSTKKRRSNTVPSQFSSAASASPVQGISASPLARGRPVRESPLQLVLGSAHAARRAEMRVPVMREAGAGAGALVGTSFVPGGLVPPIVPSAPLTPLVAQLVPNLALPPGTSQEARDALRGMQAERALLDRAQVDGREEMTPEQIAHVLFIEAECLRLRRDSAETAALRQEIELLRAQLREREQDQGMTRSERESLEQDYTTTTTTSRESDVVSEGVDMYSDAGSDDTAPTATEATLPEATANVSIDPPSRSLQIEDIERNLRSVRGKDRTDELRMRMDDTQD